MNAAIAEPRAEVGETAPKIVSFEIPMDKIGEVIGPKGKVINAIQQETGADINVDDDGVVGTVTIGSTDGARSTRPARQIELILNPPTADVGQVYKGKVVNITKFGAFVNILPGRDGLVHISKLGGGKRIDRVEDVRRPRRRDRGAGRRHRPQGQGQPHPGGRLGGDAGSGGGDSFDAERPLVGPGTVVPAPASTAVGAVDGGRRRPVLRGFASTTKPARTFGDLGPTAAAPAGGDAAAAVTAPSRRR